MKEPKKEKKESVRNKIKRNGATRRQTNEKKKKLPCSHFAKPKEPKVLKRKKKESINKRNRVTKTNKRKKKNKS